MARSRIPAGKAAITGADIKNPGRHAGRKPTASNKQAVGSPPSWMSKSEKEAWKEFKDELPWLTYSHRALLQLASHLRARFNSDEPPGVSAMNTYQTVLSKLGATPADESKVAMPSDEDEEDPNESFFH